jgi:hypothetical protein
VSADLVEIAIDQFTDWNRFEALAAEIMRAEGYPDIKVMGGVHDEGQDARVERFYVSTGKRDDVVFQFSLREDVGQKVKETIDRLRKANVRFQKLVIVTTASMTPELQRKITVKTRTEEGIDLEIYERRTVANRLGDTYLFARFFPDVEKQVAALLGHRGPDSAAEREREQLKVCYALLLAEDARRTRDALVDAAVLSLLTADGQTTTELMAIATTRLAADVFQEGQVRSSLERLSKRQFVSHTADRFALSAVALAKVEAAGAAIEAAGRAIGKDLTAEVEAALRQELPTKQRNQLEENAREVLAEFFRTNGLEIAKAFALGEGSLVYKDLPGRCVELAKRGLPAHIGDLLLTAVGSALASPTREQATYFAKCSRAYIALQVLNCDPALREFQVTRFKTKTFVLDTDFVLHALIEELPLSGTYRRLHRDLAELGARVVIPEEVVAEVVTHLEIAPRTFDYFGGGINGLSAELATERVWNALVRGYWHSTVEKGRLATRDGFLRYRENYFDASAPTAFVRQALADALPAAIVLSTAAIAQSGWAAEDEQRLTDVFGHVAQRSPKAPDRTEEQRRALAAVDARLFLAIHVQNQKAKDVGVILGQAAYIVTSSGRFVRAGRDAGQPFAFSTRPQVLAALIGLVTPRSIGDREYVGLFENPLLHRVVDETWPELKVLLVAGLDLREKSLTRLKADVEQRLHEHIIRLERADTAAEQAEDQVAGTKEEHADDEHLVLLKEAKRYGYRTVPLLEDLLAREEAQAGEMARLAEENAALRDRIQRFGKKHERWLRRLKRKQ